MVELIKQAIADNSKVGNMMSTYIDKKMMGRLLTRILTRLLTRLLTWLLTKLLTRLLTRLLGLHFTSVRYTNEKYLNMISVD